MVKKNTIQCTCCGKEKNQTEYYASSSYFHRHNSKLHVCKECVWNYVGEDNSLKKIKEVLRMLDKPFIIDLWESSVQEAEKAGKSYFKIFMKNLGLRQNRDLTWDDSDFEGHTKTATPSVSHEIESEEYDIDGEIIRYWGNGYENWEYAFLENEKIKLMSSFECPDYGMEMIMKDICFINLDIEKIRQERRPNSSKEITALIKTRSDLMNDANMKPIQSTGAEANDQITFGTLIKKWENERPLPKPLDDEMKEYIDTYMVGHLAKMEGLNNDLTEKYDKALSEYTINFSDINKDQEEYED